MINLRLRRTYRRTSRRPCGHAWKSDLRRLERDHETEGTEGAVRYGGEIEHKLINAEREQIYRLRQQGAFSDEAKRRIERELDLEEARILQKGQDPA